MTSRIWDADLGRRRFLELGLKGGAVIAAAPSVLSQFWACKSSPEAAGTAAVDPGLLGKAIAKALARGGDFADVYVEHRVSRSILLEEAKYKRAVFGVSQGVGVRVLAGDKTGFAYTDEATEEKVLRAAEVASAIAQSTQATTAVELKECRRPSYITVKVPLGEVADAKRLEVMLRAHQAALDYKKESLRFRSIHTTRSGAGRWPIPRGSSSGTSCRSCSSSSKPWASETGRPTWAGSA